MAIIYSAGTIPGGGATSYSSNKRPFVKAAKTRPVVSLPAYDNVQVRVSIYISNNASGYYAEVGGVRFYGNGQLRVKRDNDWTILPETNPSRLNESLREIVVKRQEIEVSAWVDGVQVLNRVVAEKGQMLDVTSNSASHCSELIVADDLETILLGSFVADVNFEEESKTGQWSGGAEELNYAGNDAKYISGSPGSEASFIGSPLPGTPSASRLYAVSSATNAVGFANSQINSGVPVALPGSAVGEIAAADSSFTLTLSVPE